ncbi:Acetyl-CoA acetyltransferase [Elsinoe australis]|uniref:Acetyl-CoA acetyltransferase n=1 Tax=Elsinoe australis TaxID=40998 RepID=A0A2P7YDL4_9PEZI|nr:Acetyl-CoA acetyltransferase [Elsinoe australis]
MAPTTEPVIIGVADIVNRTSKAIEPLDLISNAIAAAIADTGLSKAALTKLKEQVDDLTIIRSWTWPYDSLPDLVADRVGIANAGGRRESEHGGNQPVKCLDEACRKIMKGERRVAVLGGGEALGSLSAAAKNDSLTSLNWTPTSTSINEVFSPTTRSLGDNLGARHGIGAPIQVYPLYENGFRAYRKQTIKGNHEESAELYSEFAEVARANQYAWNYHKAVSKDEIMTIGKENRMIASPYPLLMNAFNNVNLAAAVVIASTDIARELGVPKEKWIYIRGAAGTSESAEFWNRSSFHHAPAISRSLDAALSASGLSETEIDLHDFYSCFPIVPKLACQHLGLLFSNKPKPITLLGGLTSFGGAGNNYSMHALTEMTRQLRKSHKGSRKNGLVLANGGVLTYQHVTVLSSHERDDGRSYPNEAVLPDLLELEAPEVEDKADGEAVIETYTVDFDRKGGPSRGHVVGRLVGNGRRFLADHGGERTLKELVSWDVEPIGRRGMVRYDSASKRNLFALGEGKGGSKL